MDVNWVQTKPIVMNEALLREAVRGQLSQELDDCEAIEEINFSEILQLQLQFRRIVKIDHLFGFKSLTRLEINNNHIEKIEGLDCLVNLIWLNMSFNNIEKIEGLGSLRKLEVVNFTNNSISVIENMDTLEKLTHFNIANNHIGQLDNVCYLSKFVDLFSLTLQGNPVAEDDSYKLFIAAHLPKLMSLDNRILDENTKKEAFIKYQTVIGILKFKELKRDNEAEVEAEVKLHKNAFVEFLNGPYLFKSLFKDDLKEERLNSVPEVAPLLEEFEQQMVALCEKIFEIGLDEHKRRESEVSTFVSAQKEAMTDCRQKMSEISVEFERKHKKVITELKQLSDPNLVRTRINHHNDEITQHCENMLTVECQLVRHLENSAS
ncbi:dynein regulatory complex subunit 3 [Antennarius striatus]|uniref:dynein regulatory complex subunit 3 n=1 Tax=Antennarius striatus TaxID=241820 RepID=UPI0035B13768